MSYKETLIIGARFESRDVRGFPVLTEDDALERIESADRIGRTFTQVPCGALGGLIGGITGRGWTAKDRAYSAVVKEARKIEADFAVVTDFGYGQDDLHRDFADIKADLYRDVETQTAQ